MTDNHDAMYWMQKFHEDKDKLNDDSKLKIIKALLARTFPYLSQEEADIFLAADSLSNPEKIVAYSAIEKKVAYAYGGNEEWEGKEREEYLEDLRRALSNFYTTSELNEIGTLILSCRDAVAVTVSLTKDHYGLRRIRNAYLPEITDFIAIDPLTGASQDLTKLLFNTGPENIDAVSRIERILGKEK